MSQNAAEKKHQEHCSPVSREHYELHTLQLVPFAAIFFVVLLCFSGKFRELVEV